MQQLRNDNGSIIVVAVLILSLLSIIGITALRTSITESQIVVNHEIAIMNFYGAESGHPVAALWCNANLVPTDDEEFDDVVLGTVEGTLGNEVSYYAEVAYTGTEEWTSKMPDVKITSYGTHLRGGESKIETTYTFSPLFTMPEAALRVNSAVDGNGVSGSLVGSTENCGEVSGILYDVEPICNPSPCSPPAISYNGTLEGTLNDDVDSPYFGESINKSDGIYPMGAHEDNILNSATQAPIIGSNNIDEASIITSEAEPGIIFIDGDAKATNLVGYGVLYVRGSIEMAGGLDWTGIILTTGNITFSGGGTKTITGSVVGGGEAIALNGSVDIEYDCSVLTDLHTLFSSYRMTSWRQL